MDKTRKYLSDIYMEYNKTINFKSKVDKVFPKVIKYLTFDSYEKLEPGDIPNTVTHLTFNINSNQLRKVCKKCHTFN